MIRPLPTQASILGFIQKSFTAERNNLEPTIARWQTQFTPSVAHAARTLAMELVALTLEGQGS